MTEPDVLIFVLGGGRGSRLFPLTQFRSKPAVPLAGKYRLIDIPISNCINSGMQDIYVLTQFLSVSLHRHIRQTYRFDRFHGGFVEILAAQQTMDAGTDWYQGTADAVRKNLKYVLQSNARYILILSGDQLYRMDYRQMVETHRESGADVTIAGLPVTADQAGSLGIIRLDDKGRVAGFLEKPQEESEVKSVLLPSSWLKAQGVESEEPHCLGSMGIYLFERQTLVDMLTKTTYEDFGREIFPAVVRSCHVQAHLFPDYWEDIGTIRAFFEANLALTRPNPQFDLFHPEAPVYTRARFLPPAHILGGQINHSIIADGCRIGRDVVIENSVIGVRAVIGDNVTIRDSVVMGADYYGTPSAPLKIESGTEIHGAIVDKNCHIGRNVLIHNKDQIETQDIADQCFIRDGVPVLVRGVRLPDGWSLST